MTTRHVVEHALKSYGYGDEVATQIVTNLLNEHAHELAEKIRNSKCLRDFTDDHMSDCNAAADLIDPEVPK